MAPILTVASDGAVHTTADFENGAADILGLSASDRAEMLSSGTSTVLRDRSNWAYYYLYRAGLLDRPSRARYVITQRGRDVLRSHPQNIDQKVLKQFAEFREYLGKSRKGNAPVESSDTQIAALQTPQGAIEEAYAVLQQQLATELLDQIMAKSPAFFEELVVKLLVKMGYGGSEQDARVTAARAMVGSTGSVYFA